MSQGSQLHAFLWMSNIPRWGQATVWSPIRLSRDLRVVDAPWRLGICCRERPPTGFCVDVPMAANSVSVPTTSSRDPSANRGRDFSSARSASPLGHLTGLNYGLSFQHVPNQRLGSLLPPDLSFLSLTLHLCKRPLLCLVAQTKPGRSLWPTPHLSDHGVWLALPAGPSGAQPFQRLHSAFLRGCGPSSRRAALPPPLSSAVSSPLHLTHFCHCCTRSPPAAPCSPRSQSGFLTIATCKVLPSNPCFLSGLLLPSSSRSVPATPASWLVFHTPGRSLPQVSAPAVSSAWDIGAPDILGLPPQARQASAAPMSLLGEALSDRPSCGRAASAPLCPLALLSFFCTAPLASSRSAP